MQDLDKLRDALRQVIDPEVGINIVDLGLVYGLERTEAGVKLALTMTSPACPMGETIAAEAEFVLQEMLPSDSVIDVALVWEPPWSPLLMSDAARSALGWDA
ncbi:MAG: metal-sulfur cluster assembly factor [Betaproteobacteria bacterium]